MSDYRHWKVEGIFPEEMQARGRFKYDNFADLDGGLITSANDSVRILYRSSPKDEWTDIPQSIEGTWFVGFIYVDNLQPGEYTLAVWDKQTVGSLENISKQQVKIYPNPSSGKIQIEFAKKGNYSLSFYQTNGTLIDSVLVNGKKKTWKLSRKFNSSEMVIIKIYQEEKLIATEKVVFIH